MHTAKSVRGRSKFDCVDGVESSSSDKCEREASYYCSFQRCRGRFWKVFETNSSFIYGSGIAVSKQIKSVSILSCHPVYALLTRFRTFFFCIFSESSNLSHETFKHILHGPHLGLNQLSRIKGDNLGSIITS